MYTKSEIQKLKKTIPEGMPYQKIADECKPFVSLNMVQNFFSFRSTSDKAAVEIVKKTKIAITRHLKEVEDAKSLIAI